VLLHYCPFRRGFLGTASFGMKISGLSSSTSPVEPSQANAGTVRTRIATRGGPEQKLGRKPGSYHGALPPIESPLGLLNINLLIIHLLSKESMRSRTANYSCELQVDVAGIQAARWLLGASPASLPALPWLPQDSTREEDLGSGGVGALHTPASGRPHQRQRNMSRPAIGSDFLTANPTTGAAIGRFGVGQGVAMVPGA
jgi:hypothetical protein